MPYGVVIVKIHVGRCDLTHLLVVLSRMESVTYKRLYNLPLVLSIRLGDQAGLPVSWVLFEGQEIGKAGLKLSLA